MKPGSLVWLVAHDLRLSWRRFAGMFRNMSGRRAGLIVAAAVACFHLLAWPAARWMANRDASGDMLYPAVAAGLLMVLPWIVSSALTNTTRALYTRGDLDLLQASPLNPRTVFAAKAFSIAVESMMATAVFILPVANMNALIGGAHEESLRRPLGFFRDGAGGMLDGGEIAGVGEAVHRGLRGEFQAGAALRDRFIGDVREHAQALQRDARLVHGVGGIDQQHRFVGGAHLLGDPRAQRERRDGRLRLLGRFACFR